MPLFLEIALFGAIGGFLRAALFDGLAWPKTVEQNDGSKRLYLGSLGDLLAGAAGAFVYWGIVLTNPEKFGLWAAALISGVIGRQLLVNFITQQHSNQLEKENTKLIKSVQRLSKDIETLSEMNTEQSEVLADLVERRLPDIEADNNESGAGTS